MSWYALESRSNSAYDARRHPPSRDRTGESVAQFSDRSQSSSPSIQLRSGGQKSGCAEATTSLSITNGKRK